MRDGLGRKDGWVGAHSGVGDRQVLVGGHSLVLVGGGVGSGGLGLVGVRCGFFVRRGCIILLLVRGRCVVLLLVGGRCVVLLLVGGRCVVLLLVGGRCVVLLLVGGRCVVLMVVRRVCGFVVIALVAFRSIFVEIFTLLIPASRVGWVVWVYLVISIVVLSCRVLGGP